MIQGPSNAHLEAIDVRLLDAMPPLDVDDLGSCDDLFNLLDEVVDREEGWLTHNPPDWACLTRPQYEMAASEEREALWCDGNQLGKSFEQALDIILTCTGTHPFRANRPVPVEVVCISVSFEQMEPLMRKLWELIPKKDIDPETLYTPGRGITGKPPRIVFTSGPGKGSVIKFATYKQGATRIAGLTADMVTMDEPPTESMYGEIRPRLLRKRGLLRVTMTPTPDMPPQQWYKERVEKGEVKFHNHGLDEDAVTPLVWVNAEVGTWLYDNLTNANVKPWPRPFLTQGEIDAYEDGLLDNEKEMRMRGAWTQGLTGRWLPNFQATKHVRRLRLSDLEGWYLVVGCDHGTQAGKQASMLVAVKDRGTPRPKVRWLAETVGEGLTRPEDDATNILQMLASRGLQWHDIDQWVGDVPTGSYRHEVKKSNTQLRQELALVLGVHVSRVPRFAVPKKGRNSMSWGVAFLNTLFGRFEDDGTPHAMVDSSCVEFCKFCEEFDGDKYHKTKDVGDAGRYPVEKAVDLSRIIVR